MNKFFKFTILTMIFMLTICSNVNAEQNNNKSYRIGDIKKFSLLTESKEKTVTINYYDYNRIQETFDYKEFKDNCWWRGL